MTYALNAAGGGSPELLSAFDKGEELARWYSVSDTVMGGVSHGRLRGTESGTALFEGHLSLENNGGFAMVRTRPGCCGP